MKKLFPTLVVLTVAVALLVGSVAAQAPAGEIPPASEIVGNENGVVDTLPTLDPALITARPDFSLFTTSEVSFDPNGASVAERVVNPWPASPVFTAVYTKTPTFYWSMLVNAAKYQFEVWNDTTETLLYTENSGLKRCNTSFCWKTPDTTLKYYDLSINGEYKWRVRALVGTTWQDWSDFAPFLVLSPGFTSTFDLNLNKWSAVLGTWTRTPAGFLKTQGLFDQHVGAIAKHLFMDFTYEAKMKRKDDLSSQNCLYYRAYPYPMQSDGKWSDGYAFCYYNSQEWKLVRYEDGVATSTGRLDASGIVKPYDWNTLKVVVLGSSHYLYINGYYLANITDATFLDGWVGLTMRQVLATKSPLLVDYARVESVSMHATEERTAPLFDVTTLTLEEGPED